MFTLCLRATADRLVFAAGSPVELLRCAGEGCFCGGSEMSISLCA